MLCLNKYRLNSFFINTNSIKIKPFKPNLQKNFFFFLSVNYHYNFHNLLFRSLIFFFYLIYFNNPFLFLTFKNKCKMSLKMPYNILNIIDATSLPKFTYSDY